MSQSDRDTNRKFKKCIKVPSADDESCAPLLMSELQSAIKKMKGKAVACPDKYPPSFLKSLGPLALQELLSIFNSSFSLAHCPQIWRVANIIPLLKAGNSPCEVVSFRPISFTSCVVKLLERILADRLYYIAETNNMFSRFQAGFRKGRSCEDQITRIVQAIEDGFQQRPMQRSVLTLLHFSKAYDTCSTSLVPAADSLKVYLKGPSSRLCFSCSTLTILQLHSTTMQLLLSLLTMSLFSPPLAKGKMLKLLPNQ